MDGRKLDMTSEVTASHNAHELYDDGRRQRDVVALQACYKLLALQTLQAPDAASVASSWRFKRCKLTVLQLAVLKLATVQACDVVGLWHYRLTML